jgi:hypothetical protein
LRSTLRGASFLRRWPPNNDLVAEADLRYREPAALATVYILSYWMSLAWFRIQVSGAFPDFPLTALAAASNSRNVEDDYGRDGGWSQGGGRTLRALSTGRMTCPGMSPNVRSRRDDCTAASNMLALRIYVAPTAPGRSLTIRKARGSSLQRELSRGSRCNRASALRGRFDQVGHSLRL